MFASGCSALVFQVAWMRELRLVFGTTTAAVAAVLAIFMAGLGIGSAILGKRADGVANPLHMYGVLETAIALSVALSPWLVTLVSRVYIGLGGQESLGLSGATVIRLALASVVMAIPTFLMGGTLPAAVRSVTRPDDERRRVLAILYGSNTLGAVFGAAITTFLALEHLGTRATLWAGCAISLLVGTIAVAHSRKFTSLPARLVLTRYETTADDRALNEDAERNDEGATPRSGIIYVTAAVLGFTFFAMELVWYRMLAPILGGTAFTFGLILCVALFGIGLGGIAYNFVFRRLRPSWSALAVTCGCEAALTGIPFALGDRLALLAAWRAESATSFGRLIVGWSYVTCIVVLPVAFVSGLQFPLLTALLGQGRQAVSRHLGMAYAWNTLGAIAGSLVGGFGAIPLLTAPGLWQAMAVVLTLLSVGILVGAPHLLRGRATAVVVAALALVTVSSLFSDGPTAAWRHSGIGAGRTRPPRSNANRIRQWVNEKRRVSVWEADGIESSIGIEATNGLGFIVNGKNDGNALGDSATQMGAPILGAALHKDPKTALVIGLGTGESAGWLADMRDIQHVDVVELEPAIDEMAFRCRELNRDVLNHPKVRRIYDDGREFVLTTDKKYDVLLSEPSNPYRAGIASLYTDEFYHAVRQRLNPGGLFIQWLQAYEVDEQTVETVLATARSAFRYVQVWQTLPMDLQLVCSDTPITYSVHELRDRISSGVIQTALSQAWHVDDVEGFLAHFVANEGWADHLVQQPLIARNTDDRTVLEYRFAKTVGRTTPFSVEAVRDRLRLAGFDRPTIDGNNVDWNQIEVRRQAFNLIFGGQLSIALLPNTEDRALVEAFEKYRNNDFSEVIDLWPAKYRKPSTDIQRLVLARSLAELGRPECLDLIAAAEERHPIDADALRAIYYWRDGNVEEASRWLESFYSRLADSPWVIPAISETALSRTIDVARADPKAARRLYSLLSQPFASLRFEEVRTLARFMVAEQIGPESMVEALSELEPHIVWTAEILEPRARAYKAVKHPLTERAERDWQWFQQHQ